MRWFCSGLLRLQLAVAACVRPAQARLTEVCGCGLRLRLASGPPERARARVAACGLRLRLASSAPDGGDLSDAGSGSPDASCNRKAQLQLKPRHVHFLEDPLFSQCLRAVPKSMSTFFVCGCALRLQLASGPPEPARARVAACGLRLRLASSAPDGGAASPAAAPCGCSLRPGRPTPPG